MNVVRLHNMNISDHSDLIEQYIDVCNKALINSKDRFPFKQILGAAREAENGSVVEVNVVGDDIASGSFVFELYGDGVTAKPHGECDGCQCDRQWSVSKAYLEGVAADPQSYVNNPAKIDWGWMYDDMG